MKLSIALIAAHVVLRFTTPGPGSFYVYTPVSPGKVEIVYSGHFTNAVHVSTPLPRNLAHQMFWVWFQPDEGSGEFIK